MRPGGPAGAKFCQAASPKGLYEQDETTEMEEGGCQSSKDEMHVKYIAFYYSTLRLW